MLLLKLSSNASLTRDASAPQDLTDQEKKGLEMDLELSDLKCGRDAIQLLEDRIRSLEQVGLTAPHAQRTQLQALKRRVRVDGYNSEKLNIPTCMEKTADTHTRRSYSVIHSSEEHQSHNPFNHIRVAASDMMLRMDFRGDSDGDAFGGGEGGNLYSTVCFEPIEG
ncbi:hypothetical protein V8E54_006799 [Elaphomyces granulatus]